MKESDIRKENGRGRMQRKSNNENNDDKLLKQETRILMGGNEMENRKE